MVFKTKSLKTGKKQLRSFSKMFTIPSHWGNVNENNFEISSYSSQSDKDQQNNQQQMLERRVWEKAKPQSL